MISIVPASWAREHFAEMLVMAQRQPIAIARHGKTLAVMWPAGSLGQQERERELLRLSRRLPELQRLVIHQKLAMQLLCMQMPRVAEIARSARARMAEWRRMGPASQAQFERWMWVLSQPTPFLPWIIADEGPLGRQLHQLTPILSVGVPKVMAQRAAEQEVVVTARLRNLYDPAPEPDPGDVDPSAFPRRYYGDWALCPDFVLGPDWENGSAGFEAGGTVDPRP